MNARWISDRQIVIDALDRFHDERRAIRLEVIMDQDGVVATVDAWPYPQRNRVYTRHHLDRQPAIRIKSG